MKDKYITPYEYALKHSIPSRTVYAWIKSGKIKDIKKVTVERILINEDYKV